MFSRFQKRLSPVGIVIHGPKIEKKKKKTKRAGPNRIRTGDHLICVECSTPELWTLLLWRLIKIYISKFIWFKQKPKTTIKEKESSQRSLLIKIKQTRYCYSSMVYTSELNIQPSSPQNVICMSRIRRHASYTTEIPKMLAFREIRVRTLV